jgi:peptide/nickel transport system permease protein
VDLLWHLALPMLIYTYGSFAFISRQMRASMLEVIRQDYIRTARSKGLAERVVVYKHALRNSLIPIITLLAGQLPAVISGSIIVESIFSIPGMGQLAIQSLNERDYPMAGLARAAALLQ